MLNDREMPNYWLYSNSRGFVFRTDTFTQKNVISKLVNYTSPDELVAVVKKQQFRNMELVGNKIKLICCRDLQSQINANFQIEQICVQFRSLQRVMDQRHLYVERFGEKIRNLIVIQQQIKKISLLRQEIQKVR
ncbi:unnamed protein product [Paramecium sonneborni]|uniref:Uncharacterized protein n=1 Tax=Paramecium sonneborni TaxID=65129 RepID=A0A8S1KPS3_9CILI|nr:unnamed protein product [Paramecium sonneborni]